jgi:DNA-binding XRE family transcriptional regulator
MGIPSNRKISIQKKLGQHIMGLRTSREITRENLSAQTGLSVDQIYNIEKGLSDPLLATIVVIAMGLGLHPMELFDFHFEID